MAVSIQSFQEDHRTVWQHYKLIQLGSDTSGEAQATAIYNEFKGEGEDFFKFIQVKTLICFHGCLLFTFLRIQYKSIE